MSDMGVGSAWHSEHKMHLNQRERAEKAEAERDEVRELLERCVSVFRTPGMMMPSLADEIDAALKEAK